MNDREYMKIALSLARRGRGFTSPNPCVGALVVKDDVIIGKGWHRAPGSAHAEVEAIDDAGKKAEGSTLYVTLEPCTHVGRTLPCTHKIVSAGIKRVVIGCRDPNPFVKGGGIRYLKDRGIEIEYGVLEQEAEVLIEDFIWYVSNDRKPFVILKCALTLDGRTGTCTGDSKWITNEKSRAFVHRIRHEADGILIGSGTLKTDNPSLTSRIDGFDSKDPVRIVLDTKLSIEREAGVLNGKSKAETVIVAGPDASEEKKALLESWGARVVRVPLKDKRIDLNELMTELGKMSVLSLLIEGGSMVAGSALKAGIINKVMFFIAPRILGGNDGVPVFRGKGPELMEDAFELKNIETLMFGNDILVQGYLKD